MKRTVEKIKAEHALRSKLVDMLTTGISTGRLEEICNAERDGRCDVRQCKVGDTLWFETYENSAAKSIGIKPHTIESVTTVYRVDHYTDIKDWQIGESAHLTPEAAQAAIQKGVSK
jgi:hypothetical protein